MAEGPVEWWTRLEMQLGDGTWNQIDAGGPSEDGALRAFQSYTNFPPNNVRNVRFLRREYTVVKSA